MDKKIEKIKEESKEDIWNNESIKTLELNLFNEIIQCKTVKSIEICMSLSRLLNFLGITTENYPFFLNLFEIENHWIIDSLIGNKDPFLFFSSIPVNTYLITASLKLLTKLHPKIIYSKTLSILLGILNSAYSSPQDGYNLYQLNFNDVNNIGKYLIKDKLKDDLNNNCIIDILDKLCSLEGILEDPNMEQMSRQANNIKTIYLDERKKMEDVIPNSLLIKSDISVNEISPEYIYID